MKLDRRTFIASGAVVAAGLGGYAFINRNGDNVTRMPGITPANAASVDLSDIMTPPELGEKSLGNPEAPVKIIEYAAATCGHCANFHTQTMPALKSADLIPVGETGQIIGLRHTDGTRTNVRSIESSPLCPPGLPAGRIRSRPSGRFRSSTTTKSDSGSRSKTRSSGPTTSPVRLT